MKATMLQSVFPTDTNPQGNLFGGQLVAWMDTAAGVAAMRHSQSTVVTARIDNIDFKVPVYVGNIVELVATVISVGRTSMVVEVVVTREDPYHQTKQLTTKGRFTMVALDNEGHPKAVPALPAGSEAPSADAD